jgi:putative aldouronate transport system permease protein
MKKQSALEQTFDVFNFTFMIVLCALMLSPVIYVGGHSLMSEFERARFPLRLFPRNLDFSGYLFIFRSGKEILTAYYMTILRTAIGTTLNVLVSAMVAYPLSKNYYPGRKAITLLFAFTMWFSGGMIPNYLVIKSLGLIDNFWVYILPGLVNPFNMLILRNFFIQIPEALEESARIEGANDIKIFTKIILPLSKAAIATIALFYAVFHWNTWFDALLYINKKELWTVQYKLQQLLKSADISALASDPSNMSAIPPAETVKMATIVIVVLPILCVYPFVQKYFIKGILIGSVKG